MTIFVPYRDSVPLPEFCTALRIDVRDVDNWRRRLELRTDYEATVRGRALHLSRPNAYELAYLDALVRVGVRPAAAVASADALVRAATYRRGADMREYMGFPAGSPEHGWMGDAVTPDTQATILAAAPDAPGVVIVHVGAIRRRVDALFDGASD